MTRSTTAGIGAVIGHEISHGFATRARSSTPPASREWWTKDDADKFKTATRSLVAQYNGLLPVPGRQRQARPVRQGRAHARREHGDLAGLNIAYKAYKLSLGGKTPPVLDGFTGDQRFFLGWARSGAGWFRDEEAANR